MKVGRRDKDCSCHERTAPEYCRGLMQRNLPEKVTITPYAYAYSCQSVTSVNRSLSIFGIDKETQGRTNNSVNKRA